MRVFENAYEKTLYKILEDYLQQADNSLLYQKNGELPRKSIPMMAHYQFSEKAGLNPWLGREEGSVQRKQPR